MQNTDTHEFKNWFGSSKVVDEEGNPLVVYHGTYCDFNRFYAPSEMPDTLAAEVLSCGNDTFGIYFTDRKSFADKFGNRVMPVYLSLQNPLNLKGVLTFEGLAEASGVDIVENRFELNRMKQNSCFYDDGFTDDIYRALESLVERFSLHEKLQDHGYDGIVFAELIEQVSLYDDQWEDEHPAGQPAESFFWEELSSFPLTRFNEMGSAEWVKWFRTEQDIWTEDGQPDRYDDMLNEEIEIPVIAVELENGDIHIWDGYHRIGASIVAGRESVPAIIGKPLDMRFDASGDCDNEEDEGSGPRM